MEIINKSMLPNCKKAETLALDLIDKYNIHEPIIDIFMICEKEGLKVEYFKSERNSKEYEIDGAFFRKENKILINSTRPPKQMVFTLAHELGHVVMHTDIERDILLRNGKSSSADYLEKEANKFAACLLMPERMIKQQMEKWGISSTHPDILANLFGVSLQSMSCRLKNLKWK